MKNIFKDAYFGKAYKTRDGKKVIYNRKYQGVHLLMREDTVHLRVYTDNGKGSNIHHDVVSEWEEESITEEEVDKLAEQLNPNKLPRNTYEDGLYSGYNDGFKACYRYLKNKKWGVK